MTQINLIMKQNQTHRFRQQSCSCKGKGRRHAKEKWMEDEKKGKDKGEMIIARADKYSSDCTSAT